MPGPLFSYPKPCVPSRMLCKPEKVYKWSHDNAKSTEVTAVVCPALLCAFSSCSLAFFPLIFLSFLVPLGWYHCFGKCHTKLSCSSTKKACNLRLLPEAKTSGSRFCAGCMPPQSVRTRKIWQPTSIGLKLPLKTRNGLALVGTSDFCVICNRTV